LNPPANQSSRPGFTFLAALPNFPDAIEKREGPSDQIASENDKTGELVCKIEKNGLAAPSPLSKKWGDMPAVF
jgi:hypothetical protein